jgi:thioredoxin-disulfide reductase
MKDVIIIGGGAAGMTAAIFCGRKKMDVQVISMDIGGQTNLTSHIENYPGTGTLPGPDLMNKFHEDAVKFGAEFVSGKVTKIEDDGSLKVTTSDNQTYEGKILIIAAGKVPRLLGVPGEDKFYGKGVSTCATCDGPLFKDKAVAIVGGGNSGVEAALDLSKIAKKVYLIHRRDKFTADEVSVDKVTKDEKVEIVLNGDTKEIKGDKFVEAIAVDVNGELKEFKVDGVFVEIGYKVESELFKDIVKVNEKGEIIIDEHCNTSHPRIFAAGDITTTPFKQTIISAGHGAIAALEAHRELSGGESRSVDW